MGQQKNKNKKNKKTKTKTKKQQQNNNKIKKKNKEKTANNNQKKVRKHHIFRRQTGRVSDTCCVKKSDSVFRTFFSKTDCRTFFTQQRKSEKRNIDKFERVSKQKAFKRRLTRWHRRERPNDTPSRTPHTESYPIIYLTSPQQLTHTHTHTDIHMSGSRLDVCVCV